MSKLWLWLACSGWAVAAIQPKILFEHDAALLNTTIQIIVTAGAGDDLLSQAGLSNLTADLMLRGTRKRSRERFQVEIERLGASVTGTATHDMMVFTAQVIRENTLALVELIEDFLVRPALEKREFESLKTELLAQISHQKNNNSRLAGLALRRAVFKGTPLEAPVIGSLSSIKKISRDHVVRKFNNHVHRGNVFFAVASALPEAQIASALTAVWLKLPDGLRLTRRLVEPKIPDASTLILVHKPKTEAGAFMVGQAGITISDPNRFSLQVGNFSFGGEPLVSRLFKIVRGELGYTYSIGSTYFMTGALSTQRGVFAIFSTPSIEFTIRALLKTFDLYRDYLLKGLTPKELELARESIINSYPFNFDSAGKRLSERIEEYLFNDPILPAQEFAKTINSVSDEVLQKALKYQHAKQGFAITLVADEAVIRKQLEDEQKEVPEKHRLQIAQVITPESVIE